MGKEEHKLDKRGELTSTQLAVIIVAIVGFAILAFALYKIFDNESLTNRDLCRLSILSRATVPGVAQQAVPLNCFTQKVCITTKNSFLGIGGKDNSCKQFAGEENVREVEVKTGEFAEREKAVETIQREVANSMFDCWLMTGQGKMDIFTKDYSSSTASGKLFEEGVEYINLVTEKIEPKCIVCSRVAFSDSLIEADKKIKSESSDKNGFLEQINYNAFMSREKVPGSSLTYFQAFTDESVGAGYGSIGGSESLSEYFGKTELNDADVTKIKSVLEQQFKNQPAELEKVSKLFESSDVKQKLLNYLKELSKPVSSNQIAIVFSQIKVPAKAAETQYWDTFKNGAILGGVAAISGPGKIVSFFLPGPGWLKALYEISAIGVTSWSLASDTEFTTGANQALSAATCGKFESTIEGKQQGCSLVKLVNWDVNTINGLCAGGIEGNL